MKKIVLLIIVISFSCKQQAKQLESGYSSQSQDCFIEKEVRECFVKILEEPNNIYPILSHMDSLALNEIQYRSNFPISFSKIKIKEAFFSLSKVEKKNMGKKLILSFEKVNCSMAKFHLTVLENDYGRVINGKITKKDNGELELRITGEADIN
ncbi:hypothetical protein [Flagellimonas marina]|uniref:Lipoprotein n=1 Tax=Flagellimonas marina TaxID=1775168 RepID=A0ABV8PM64_9FLAO